MRQFLLQVSKFVGLLVIISIAIRFMLPDNKYYGNNTFRAKLDNVSRHRDRYNFYFFGSSRIATGLNPVIFDSLLAQHGIFSTSYNVASYGTWFSEDQYLLDNFIKEVDVHDAVIVLEFQNAMSIEWKKLDTDKNLYYQSLENYKFIKRFVKARHSDNVVEYLGGMHYLISHSISGILYTMNLGMSDRIYSSDRSSVDFDRRGFRSLATRDSTRLNPAKFKASAENAFVAEGPANSAFITKINDMIEEAKARNIYLFFVLTTKNYTKEMASVFKAIPAANRIDYQEFLKQKSLYRRSVWADLTHLNEEGALQYTKFIVEELSKKNPAIRQ